MGSAVQALLPRGQAQDAVALVETGLFPPDALLQGEQRRALAWVQVRSGEPGEAEALTPGAAAPRG